MRTLTEGQRAEIERLAVAERVDPYDRGVLAAYERSTDDPAERRRIQQALDRHGRKAST